MNRLEAVVFDCDGVILESADIKSEAFRRLGGLFGPEIQNRFYEHHLRHAGVSRYEKFAWLYRAEFGREITAEESRRLGELFSGHCLEAVLAAPFVPGFEEALAWFKSRAVPLFVASGTPQAELETVLTAKGLAKSFQAVLGTPPAKSRLLGRIVTEGGFDPGRVLMVGDGETDLQAARENGTLFFGRGAGFQGRGLPWAEDLAGLAAQAEKFFLNDTAKD
jgi:phosphoglycolate phosphatase-like HAD superfamily hydrolase